MLLCSLRFLLFQSSTSNKARNLQQSAHATSNKACSPINSNKSARRRPSCLLRPSALRPHLSTAAQKISAKHHTGPSSSSVPTRDISRHLSSASPRENPAPPPVITTPRRHSPLSLPASPAAISPLLSRSEL